jgi:uncharacterized protein with NRDE domain
LLSERPPFGCGESGRVPRAPGVGAAPSRLARPAGDRTDRRACGRHLAGTERRGRVRRRSRGLLVADALGRGSATRAAEAALQFAANAYNPFNLFVADAHHAFAVVYEEKPRVRMLAPGAHVIGNADPDDIQVPKIARLLGEAEEIARGPEDTALDALSALCRSHDARGDNAFERTCIHTTDYGTRSSTVLRRGVQREADVLRFASGAPCETAYEDLTPLLRALD